MKKESLSIITVKTLLAMLILVGIGMITIIGEYSKNEASNKIAKPVDQEAENYYYALEKKYNLKEGCRSQYDKYGDYCIYSFEIMKENNYREVGENGECPEGFRVNQLEGPWEGLNYNFLVWCEPAVTRDDVLIATDKTEYQQGE